MVPVAHRCEMEVQCTAGSVYEPVFPKHHEGHRNPVNPAGNPEQPAHPPRASETARGQNPTWQSPDK